MDPLAPLRTTHTQDAPVSIEPPKPTVVEVVKGEMGRALALKLVQDKVYVRGLRKRLREGRAGSNAMELMLWERAFGAVEKGVGVQIGVQVGKPW